MTRFASLAVAAATALAATAPAFAGDSAQTTRPAPPSLQRVVMECDRDAATVRGFRREHRARPVFITADQVLTARASGETWAAPRCMTARERGRLVQMMSSRAGIR